MKRLVLGVGFAFVASLLLVAAAPAHAQIAAAVVAPGNQGVLHLDAHGNGVFAVVAINLGPTPGIVLEGQHCGGFDIRAHGAPATRVCALDTATGACTLPILETLSAQIEQGAVGVYGVLVGGAQAGDRITVTFTQYGDDASSFPFHCQFPSHPHVVIAERGAVSILATTAP